MGTLSHSHTILISHSLTLDMLNKFCFHLYAQNSLFIGENCNAFFSPFSPSSSPHPPCMLHVDVLCRPACNRQRLRTGVALESAGVDDYLAWQPDGAIME